MNLENKNIGIAITGAFSCIPKTIEELKKISKINGINIIPIMSYNTYNIDNKYGKAKDFILKIEEISKNKIINSIEKAETIGSKIPCDILAIVPCTGNTISKLATNIIDTPVTMAAKSQLKNEKPLVIAISTNDGLSGSAENIGKLLNRKNYYFVPFMQDNPITKPRSLVFANRYLIKSMEYALNNEQIQPILL